MSQGGYGANNLVGIKEDFANLDQATAEDRAAVTNLTDANKNLITQVTKQANHSETKDASIETMHKFIQKTHGDIKTLTTRQAGQSTKKNGSLGYKKGSWWSSPYCCTHGFVGQDVEH